MTTDRARRSTRPAAAWLAIIPFVLVALMPIVQAWSLWTMDPTAPGAWLVDRFLPALGSFAMPLIGAALLIRHPDARRRLPLVLMGAVLLAAHEVLQQAVGPIATLISRDPDIGGPSVMVALAIEGVFSTIAAFGFAYLARGLSQARRFEDRGPVRFFIVAVIVIVVAFGLLLVSILSSYGLPTAMEATVVTVVSFGSLMARTLALGYLAVAVARGWLAGEAPRRAWALAALGAWITFLAAVLWPAIGYVAGIVQVPDALSVLRVLAIAGGIGPVLLLAAFIDGIPDTDGITWYDLAELDAAEAAGPTRDPFDDSAAGDEAELFELEDRRLER